MSLENELRQLINDSDESLGEKCKALAQVMIDLGMAAEQLGGPLSMDRVKSIERDYYDNPTLGKAMILQGVIMLGSWDKK